MTVLGSLYRFFLLSAAASRVGLQSTWQGIVHSLPTSRTFIYALEGHPFNVSIGHKLGVYTLHSSSDRYSTREIRHVDFLSQFTVVGTSIADALSRIHQFRLTPGQSPDRNATAQAQAIDPDINQSRQCGSSNVTAQTFTATE